MKLSEAVYLRSVVEQAVQSLPNKVALTAKSLYPTFDSIIGEEVKQGLRFTYSGKLWEVVSPKLTIVKHYPPDAGTESLYTEVNDTNTGTLDDPIPYEGNIALVNGLHYIQNGVIYRCIRDTVNPVYNALSELVGLYIVEV